MFIIANILSNLPKEADKSISKYNHLVDAILNDVSRVLFLLESKKTKKWKKRTTYYAVLSGSMLEPFYAFYSPALLIQ